MKNLDDIRLEINEVDDQLLDLIIRRLNLSKDVAEYKQSNNIPVLDRDRELWILDHITEGKSADLVVPLLETYESIFRVSRRRQNQLINPDDTFINAVKETITEDDFPSTGVVAISNGILDMPVTEALFNNPRLLTFSNDMKIVDAVNAGLCEYGILPIEDNRTGVNAHTYDLLLTRTCHIVRGIKLNLHYKLVAPQNVPFTSLKTVVLDQRAYNHCSKFLDALTCEIVVKTSDDIIKDLVDPSDNFIGWIVPSHMSITSEMRVLRSEVANEGDYIRFICLAKKPQIYPNADYVSVMLSVPNVSGGLDEVLSPLAALGVNLTMLESRPVLNEDSRHRFFLDMEGDIREEQLQRIINDLSRSCPTFSLLGAYEHVELSL